MSNDETHRLFGVPDDASEQKSKQERDRLRELGGYPSAPASDEHAGYDSAPVQDKERIGPVTAVPRSVTPPPPASTTPKPPTA